jgi:hypothetical protein
MKKREAPPLSALTKKMEPLVLSNVKLTPQRRLIHHKRKISGD